MSVLVGTSGWQYRDWRGTLYRLPDRERFATWAATTPDDFVLCPPNFPANPTRLEAALDEFPGEVRVAVELRHPSWFTERTRALLVARGAVAPSGDA